MAFSLEIGLANLIYALQAKGVPQTTITDRVSRIRSGEYDIDKVVREYNLSKYHEGGHYLEALNPTLAAQLVLPMPAVVAPAQILASAPQNLLAQSSGLPALVVEAPSATNIPVQPPSQLAQPQQLPSAQQPQYTNPLLPILALGAIYFLLRRR